MSVVMSLHCDRYGCRNTVVSGHATTVEMIRAIAADAGWMTGQELLSKEGLLEDVHGEDYCAVCAQSMYQY